MAFPQTPTDFIVSQGGCGSNLHIIAPNGALYIIGSRNTNNDGYMKMAKVTGDASNSANWTFPFNSSNGSGHNDTISAVLIGNIIYMIYQITSSARYLYFVGWDTSTDTLVDLSGSSPLWITMDSASPSLSDNRATYMSGNAIADRGNGDVILHHDLLAEKVHGTNYARNGYSTYIGTTFTQDVAIGATGVAVDECAGGIVQGLSNQIYFVWTEGQNTPSNLKVRGLTSGGSLQTLRTINTGTSGGVYAGNGCTTSRSGTSYGNFPFFDVANNTLYRVRFQVYGDDTAPSFTLDTVYSNVSDWNDPLYSTAAQHISLAMDTQATNNPIYAVVVDATSADVLLYDDGGSNGNFSDTLSGGTLATGATAWSRAHGSFLNRSGTKSIAFDYYDWATDGSTSWYYDEYSLGAASYSLSIVHGSFTLTGQTVNLLKDSVISAAFGDFTFTGQTVNLNFSYNMPVDYGSFTLSGQDVNFLFDPLISAEVGSYSITGTDVNLLLGALISAVHGTYTLTGTDVNLILGYALTADFGSFALTGTDVNLLSSRLLSAESGSFALTGTDVNLLSSYLISVTYGMFTFTGQDANLFFSTTMQAEAGSFTLSGQDANLLAARTISADFGSFTFTGEDVNFQFSTILSAEFGSFTLSGQDVNFLVDYVFPAEFGSFTFTGEDANLLFSTTIAADFGSYTLTGTDVNLIPDYLISAVFGDFTLTGQTVNLIPDYLISALFGSFTFTGEDVTLTYTPVGSYTLQADYGAFTLTGETVNLIPDYLVSAAFGDFALTGQNVNLLNSALISATFGNFTLTGTDVNLIPDYLVSAAFGNFTFSGQDVTLTYTPVGSYTLPVDAGLFTLTGENVNLLGDFQIPAAFGDFTLTGENVNLLLNYVISAESGLFTLTGENVNLTRDAVIFAAFGDFTFTGIAVNLQASTAFDVTRDFDIFWKIFNPTNYVFLETQLIPPVYDSTLVPPLYESELRSEFNLSGQKLLS